MISCKHKPRPPSRMYKPEPKDEVYYVPRVDGIKLSFDKKLKAGLVKLVKASTVKRNAKHSQYKAKLTQIKQSDVTSICDLKDLFRLDR